MAYIGKEKNIGSQIGLFTVFQSEQNGEWSKNYVSFVWMIVLLTF
jgi:hypothetical protein